MTTIADIAAYLEEKVPSSLKMDFDNVGLLCGFPEKSVSRALVALDVTAEVIEEAATYGAELILIHHPLIFHPMKTVRTDDLTGKLVIGLIQNGASAICLHTNLDVVEGGVNDALAAAIGATVCDKLPCGRVVELPAEESMDRFTKRIRDALGVSGLRYYDSGRSVKRIALCGGSGGELVYEAPALGCDTVLTGEVKYNQWLDAKALGINVVDADHFCTENVVVPVLADLLHEGFPELEVRISRCHGQTLRG